MICVQYRKLENNSALLEFNTAQLNTAQHSQFRFILIRPVAVTGGMVNLLIVHYTTVNMRLCPETVLLCVRSTCYFTIPSVIWRKLLQVPMARTLPVGAKVMQRLNFDLRIILAFLYPEEKHTCSDEGRKSLACFPWD